MQPDREQAKKMGDTWHQNNALLFTDLLLRPITQQLLYALGRVKQWRWDTQQKLEQQHNHHYPQ